MKGNISCTARHGTSMVMTWRLVTHVDKKFSALIPWMSKIVNLVPHAHLARSDLFLFFSDQRQTGQCNEFRTKKTHPLVKPADDMSSLRWRSELHGHNNRP